MKKIYAAKTLQIYYRTNIKSLLLKRMTQKRLNNKKTYLKKISDVYNKCILIRLNSNPFGIFH